MQENPLMRLCMSGSFFRGRGIGRGFVGAACQIIDAGAVVVRQLADHGQRNIPLAPFVFGVQRLVTAHDLRDRALLQVPVLPHIPNSQLQSYHREKYTLVQYVLLYFRTIRPKIYPVMVVMAVTSDLGAKANPRAVFAQGLTLPETIPPVHAVRQKNISVQNPEPHAVPFRSC